MGNHIGFDAPPSPGFGDLPEALIANIFAMTTPRDVARLACVNNSFRAAAYSDSVWESMLPSSYIDILAQAKPEAAPLASSCLKKDIYDYLSNSPILIENGTQVCGGGKTAKRLLA